MIPTFYALPGNEDFCCHLVNTFGGTIGDLEVRSFPDGETYVRVDTSPQAGDAILVSTLVHPDDRFLPIAFAADALRDMGARSVGLVAPYLAYMRQDKRFRPGEAVTSETFARLVSNTVDWMVTVDPHLHRRRDLAEIYTIPSLALHAGPVIGEWIARTLDDALLVGPDVESTQWVEAVAATAGAPFIILEKIRHGDRDVSVSDLDARSWQGRTPVLVDDIISTARTMIETVGKLKEDGFSPPICIGVHGLFADGAFDDLRAAGAGQIITCNTVAHASNQIDLSPLVAEGIRSILSMEKGR